MPQITSFPSRLSASDRVMWRIERDPLLRSVVVAVGLLDQEPDWKGARATFEHATEQLPRLRQRIVSGGPGGGPHWADDPGFSLDYHIRRVAAPSPGDLRALLDLVAPIASCALDPARPLWECTVVDGLEGGRGAFVWKFHHTMTDGVGGMELAGDVFDCARHGGSRVDTPATPAPDATRAAGPLERLVQSGLAGMRVMSQPGRVATDAARFGRSIARMLAPAAEPLSPVLRGRSLDRRFDVLEVPLASMRDSAQAVDGTINDVFLAGVGGGLHEFHRRLGHALPAVRVTMPINLRREGDPPGGNRFTPVRFILPIDDPDPAFRARIAGAISRKWRAEPAVGLTSVLADLLDRLPPPVLARVFGAMLKNVDIGAVDVPGFRDPAYLGGARVERIWGFSPPTGAALSVTLLSHVDTCCIGVASDLAAVPDPDLLVSCLRDSFDEVTAIGGKSTASSAWSAS
jgi:diacylglycerol O-acyltransferase / wax synthase